MRIDGQRAGSSARQRWLLTWSAYFAVIWNKTQADLGAPVIGAILFDLDGVLYQGEVALHGAREAVAFVQSAAIPHLFVTNTTSRPRSAIVDKLSAMGIETSAAQIFTPAVAASEWLRGQGLGPVALLVPDATRAEFQDTTVCELATITPVQALVVGDLGEAWTYSKLNHALRLLMDNPDCQLLALGMTRYWQAEDGLRLDTGAFVTALQFASGRGPVVLGKPSADFFAAALARLDMDAANTWMLGDDIQSDIGGAQQAGLRGALVCTGKFRASDLEGSIVPDAVLDSVASLPEWWARMDSEQV